MFKFELIIMNLLQDLRNDFLNTFFEVITMLGEETIMIIIIAILYFACNKEYAKKLAYISLTSLGINSVIKNIVKLPRPFTHNEITCLRPETATGYSFPSGHTQNFSTWSATIALTLKKKWFWILIIILVILLALSRIYLGAHYPTDVIAGATLGIILAIILSKIYDKFENKNKLFLYTFLILTPFASVLFINPELLYEDFYKVYGMIIGVYLAVILEEKYVQLEYNISPWKKALRVVLAVILAYILKKTISYLYLSSIVEITLLLNALYYFVLVFIIFGIYPIILKKLNI